MLALKRRTRRGHFPAAVIVLVFLAQIFWPLSLDGLHWPLLPTQQKDRAANATLGFGRIYAVSKPGSLRRDKLLRAANVTELQLTIPVQPVWTEERVAGFKLREDSKLAHGTMLAWMGHLHALQEFLWSGDETALFIEDDVDWDIHLRSVQVPLVSVAMRTLFPDSVSAAYPYGRPADWDLLYLGHCGDYWHATGDGFDQGHVKPQDLMSTPHAAVVDKTLPGQEDLHPWTASLLENLGVEPDTRLVHRSRFPLCTFAYAVTRATAMRLLGDLAGRERKDGPPAYDVAVLEACRDNGLHCWSVNPELFHHTYGKSIIGGMDNAGGMPPVDHSGFAQAKLRGETPNIGCGFASGAFDFQDGDLNRLAWLRQEVGRKGRCIKPGRDREIRVT